MGAVWSDSLSLYLEVLSRHGSIQSTGVLMVLPVIGRAQVLAFRQQALHLHRRLPKGRLVEAAYAGLQDSSPRSAILSLHARVQNVSASDWEDPQLVQIWGPRGADYVVPGRDVAVFTIGRL